MTASHARSESTRRPSTSPVLIGPTRSRAAACRAVAARTTVAATTSAGVPYGVWSRTALAMARARPAYRPDS